MPRLIFRVFLCLVTTSVQTGVLYYTLHSQKPFKVMEGYDLISLALVATGMAAAIVAVTLFRTRPWPAPYVALALSSAGVLLFFLVLQFAAPDSLSRDFNRSEARDAFLPFWLLSIGLGFAVAFASSVLCHLADEKWFEGAA